MDWHVVAFPLILPWREEFWTLPLYFPNLQVGVTPGWPAQLPYQGLPLSPEAQGHPQELKHYHPGDLRQWQAYEAYQEAQAEAGDLLRDIRQYGRVEAPQRDSAPDAWSLAWQLEKLQADQEAQLQLVDRGQEWLKEILSPEPWEEPSGFGPVPGVPEMVDPELARLRYALWQRVMAQYLQKPWAPFLLGRTSRSLFLSLKGWPEWSGLQKVQVSLPGCRTAAEWGAICGNGSAPPWQQQAVQLLAAILTASADLEEMGAAARELAKFVSDTVIPQWPFPVAGNFDLEVWAPDSEDGMPVLCWSEAGAGVVPG